MQPTQTCLYTVVQKEVYTGGNDTTNQIQIGWKVGTNNTFYVMPSSRYLGSGMLEFQVGVYQ